MPSATSSTRPRVFSRTPTESASWRERPVARAEKAPASELRAGGDDEHDQHLAAGAEVEVAEVGGRARQDEVERQQEQADHGRHANGARGERARARAARRARRRRMRRRRSAGPAPRSRAPRRRGRLRRASSREPPRQARAAVQALPVGDRGRARRARRRGRPRRRRASRPRARPSELFASSASASAIQLSTSFTAAQLTASEPTARADEAVLLEDPREHRERRDRDRRADEEHERRPADGGAVDDVVPAEEPERDRDPGEERQPEDRRRDQREVVRPRQVRAVEPRADRERERDEADRPEVAHDPDRVRAESRSPDVAPTRARSARSRRPARSCPITAGCPSRGCEAGRGAGSGEDDRHRDERAATGERRPGATGPRSADQRSRRRAMPTANSAGCRRARAATGSVATSSELGRPNASERLGAGSARGCRASRRHGILCWRSSLRDELVRAVLGADEDEREAAIDTRGARRAGRACSRP